MNDNIKQNFTLEKAFKLFQYYERIINSKNVYVINNSVIACLHISENGVHITYDHIRDIFVIEIPGYSDFLVPNISYIPKIIKYLNIFTDIKSIFKYLSNNCKINIWLYDVENYSLKILDKCIQETFGEDLNNNFKIDYCTNNLLFKNNKTIPNLSYEVILVECIDKAQHKFSRILDCYTLSNTVKTISTL